MSRFSIVLLGAMVLCLPPAAAQNVEPFPATPTSHVGAGPSVSVDQGTAPIGPDVIVGDLPNMNNYGSQGGISAFSVGTDSCNIGDEPLLWIAGTNEHPVIAQNMFRLKDDRFEQIGMSWLKHGFFALNFSLCDTCQNPGTGALLGVGCSDPYSAGLNGQQSNLGPRSQVNAHTGVFTFPPAIPNPGCSGCGLIDRRLQVHDVDVAPLLNLGAQYFVEGHYVTPDDAMAGNGNNNASYRPITIISPGVAVLTGQTQRKQPAIRAWQDTDPSVVEKDVPVPSEGLFILAAKAIDLGNGFWRYEYALQNLNSDRSGGSFSVPVSAGAVVDNVGFHDVDYHSGEPYDLSDWSAIVADGSVTWSTTSFDVNPDANALRWGTLYNFRFDADVLPDTTMVTIGLFKPGFPEQVMASTLGPVLGLIDCNGNGVDDAQDIADGTSLDCNTNGIPDECDVADGDPEAIADCNGNLVPDFCDLNCGASTGFCAVNHPSCGGSADCNENCVPDECEACFASAPAQADMILGHLGELVVSTKNRYLSFAVNEPGRIQALRVTFNDLNPPHDVLNGLTMWVGEPQILCEVGSPPLCGPTQPSVGATLQCNPFFTDWSPGAPGGTVHVWHEGIVPGGVYSVRVVDCTCPTSDKSSFSAPLEVTMARWGDTVKDCTVVPCPPPDGVVNILDVLAIVDKFVNAAGAIIKARADLQPETPDRIVDILDALQGVDAFLGLPYPFQPGPVPCP